MTIVQQLKARCMEEGRLEAKHEIAQRMLAHGIKLKLIAEITELPLKYIRQLQEFEINILT